MNEGLRSILNNLKKKFTQVVQYLFGWTARFGSYWLAVDDEGEVKNAITPLTAGQAFVDGHINKKSTAVILDRPGQRAVGLKTGTKDVLNLYKESSLQMWKSLLTESTTEDEMNKVFENLGWTEDQINEVRLANDDPQAKYNVVGDEGLKKAIEMSLKNKGLARLLIYGAPGVGKTAIVRRALQMFPEYDGNLIVKTLSNETADNFTLPKYVEVNGQERAADVPKTWLPVYKPTGDREADQLLDDACGRGLLFIDELSRATPQVLNVLLPIIMEGNFNGYNLGSGWTVICASNRASDDMTGQSDIGNALSNRFRTVYYEPMFEDWKKWAEKQRYISPLLLSWLSLPEGQTMSGGKYFYWDPNEDSEADESKLMCTPRAWDMAMRTLAEYANTADMEGFKLLDIPRDILAMALNQSIPAEAVDSFLAFLSVIDKIGDLDSAVKGLWAGRGLNISKKDLRLIALPLAQIIVTSKINEYPTKEEMDNLADWVVAQGSDQLASYIINIIVEVFGSTLREDIRGGIFILQKKYQTLSPSQKNTWDEMFAPFFSAWGFDGETVPDWSEAHAKLVKKFGDTFMKAKVDGVSALG